jgi:hypothetical protein
MSRSSFSRRQFLRGCGQFALAIPFLPSLASRAAAASGVSKKFAAFWSPNGHYKRQYWPSQDPQTLLAPGVYGQSLTSLPGDISQVITESAFGSMRSKLLLLRGLDGIINFGHNGAMMLGASYQSSDNTSANPTIDYYISRSSQIYPSEPWLRSLHLRPHPNEGDAGYKGISYMPTGTGVGMNANYWSTQTAFNAVFGQMSSAQPGSSTSTTSTSVDARAADNRKVVDKVFADYQKLRSGSKISQEDRLRLDAHMSKLNDLQNRIGNGLSTSTSTVRMGCQKPTLRSEGTTWDANVAIKNHIDIIVAALSCGLTSVATLMMRTNPYFDFAYSHDALSHNADQTGNPQLQSEQLKVSQWYAQQFAYLIQQMDQVKEANGTTLLDNSVAYWGSEIGHSLTHRFDSFPVLLAGGAGGYLKTGSYYDYRQRPQYKKTEISDLDSVGRPYNQLLVTIAQAMGLQPSDYEYNGQPGVGENKPLNYGGSEDGTKIYGSFLNLDSQRNPLPLLKA